MSGGIIRATAFSNAVAIYDFRFTNYDLLITCALRKFFVLLTDTEFLESRHHNDRWLSRFLVRINEGINQEGHSLR